MKENEWPDVMPDDYLPKSPCQGVTIYWDDEKMAALEGIPADEFKACFLAMLNAARDYSQTVDKSIRPDDSKFSDMARLCMKFVYAGMMRSVDGWRETCFKRAKGGAKRKGGGDDDPPSGLPQDVKNTIAAKVRDMTARGVRVDLSEAVRFVEQNSDLSAESALMKLERAKMGLI